MNEEKDNKDLAIQAEKQIADDKKEREMVLLEEKIAIVKIAIQKTLERIENKKVEKQKVEEELRILKLDLDDLRSGKFDKIAERRAKSDVAKKISVEVMFKKVFGSPQYSAPEWQYFTSGTFLTPNNTFYF